MTVKAPRPADAPPWGARICRSVAKLWRLRHPRCPGPNGAPGPSGPADWRLEFPPPAPDDAPVEDAPLDEEEPDDDAPELGLALADEGGEDCADSLLAVVVDRASVASLWLELAATAVRLPPLLRARDGRCAWIWCPRPRLAPVPRACVALPTRDVRVVIGGTADPITAGLSPADAWSVSGERTGAGQNEPIAAMTKRQDAATAAVAVRGRIRRAGTTNARDRPGRPRRLTAAMPSPRRPRSSVSASPVSGSSVSGFSVSASPVSASPVTASTVSPSTFCASTLAGPTTSGARIAFWIEAESSPQKSSARTGGGGSSGSLGPNGTSSSRGPNQSRGMRTTFDSDAAASSPDV